MKKMLSLLLFGIMFFSFADAKENSVKIGDCKVTISVESIKDFSPENKKGIVSYKMKKNNCKGVKVSLMNVLGGDILYKKKNNRIVMRSLFHNNYETVIQFSVSKHENGFTYKKVLSISLDMGVYNFKCDTISELLGLCPNPNNEMTEMSSGVCSIKYNLSDHKTIDVNDGYLHSVKIEDCNIENYLVQVFVETYDELDLKLSGHLSRYNVYESTQYPYKDMFAFNINRSSTEKDAYYTLEYSPRDQDYGKIYSPKMIVKIIDETGMAVQIEEFDMTSFEFVNNQALLEGLFQELDNEDTLPVEEVEAVKVKNSDVGPA